MPDYHRHPDLVDYLKGQEREKSQLHRPTKPHIHLYRDADQSIPDATDTDIIWDTEIDNRFGMWDSSDPTNYYLPKPGLWVASLQVRFDTNATGFRGGAVFGEWDRRPAITGAESSFWVTAALYFTSSVWNPSVGAVTRVHQNSGGALNLVEARLTVAYLAT